MNILYVGDIHSNAHRLEALLAKAPSNSFYCFLGDIWDCRDEESNLWQYNSAKVFDIVLELQTKQKAVVLQSNHQYKLLRHLLGIKVNMTPMLAKTIAELLRFDKTFIKHWLLSLPYGFSTEVNGKVHRAAHAYYVPEMNEIAPSKYARNIALHGLHKKYSNERMPWWLEPQQQQDFVRVAGHYHEVFIDEQSIVLDGGCGSNNGRLLAYAPATQTLYEA